jgi:hypothetical protein
MNAYRGYTGTIRLEDGDDEFHGTIDGLKDDIVTFAGRSPAEVLKAFHDSVDDYLAFCAGRGKAPEVPETMDEDATGLGGNKKGTFVLGDRVTKKKGSCWTGRVVGFYSTAHTPVGYCVESETERGSVQIYPEAALKLMPGPDDA